LHHYRIAKTVVYVWVQQTNTTITTTTTNTNKNNNNNIQQQQTVITTTTTITTTATYSNNPKVSNRVHSQGCGVIHTICKEFSKRQFS